MFAARNGWAGATISIRPSPPGRANRWVASQGAGGWMRTDQSIRLGLESRLSSFETGPPTGAITAARAVGCGGEPPGQALWPPPALSRRRKGSKAPSYLPHTVAGTVGGEQLLRVGQPPPPHRIDRGLDLRPDRHQIGRNESCRRRNWCQATTPRWWRRHQSCSSPVRCRISSLCLLVYWYLPFPRRPNTDDDGQSSLAPWVFSETRALLNSVIVW